MKSVRVIYEEDSLRVHRPLLHPAVYMYTMGFTHRYDRSPLQGFATSHSQLNPTALKGRKISPMGEAHGIIYSLPTERGIIFKTNLEK